jgi:hypothetical protein
MLACLALAALAAGAQAQVEDGLATLLAKAEAQMQRQELPAAAASLQRAVGLLGLGCRFALPLIH